MRNLVIDASVLLSFVLPDEQVKQEVIDLFKKYKERKIEFYAPLLIEYEVANALRSAVLSGRIKKGEALKFLDALEKIEINRVEPEIKTALNLSFKHKISVYDAVYLALALTRRMRFLTWDRKLAGIH